MGPSVNEDVYASYDEMYKGRRIIGTPRDSVKKERKHLF